MLFNASWGELLIGAYHKRLNGCEVVSYNNRSEEPGNQMEAELIAIDNDRETGEQNVYVWALFRRQILEVTGVLTRFPGVLIRNVPR